MDFKSAVDHIYGLGMFSRQPTLDRVKTALKALDAENAFPVIHIAGTNGKGSVSAYVSTALKSAGYRTGLFVSPHILDIRERVQINGEMISKADFTAIAEEIISKDLPLTTFEFLTVMAFMYFGRKGIDVAVLETGLGGRLDATNAAKNKLIAVLTEIGLDHTAILGDTVEKIAAEKCGIITGEKAVCAPYMRKAALDVIKKHAKELVVPDLLALKSVSVSPNGNCFIYKDEEYKTAMFGEYQIENALIAVETLKNCGLSVTEKAIKEGLLRAFMPARLQVVGRDPLTIVDGAHNPDGAAALAKTLATLPPFTAVIGLMRDKDYEKVLSLTLPAAKNVICVKAYDSGRALSAEELSAAAKRFNGNCVAADSIKAALERARALGAPTVVFGSLYLASNALEILKNDN